MIQSFPFFHVMSELLNFWVLKTLITTWTVPKSNSVCGVCRDLIRWSNIITQLTAASECAFWKLFSRRKLGLFNVLLHQKNKIKLGIGIQTAQYRRCVILVQLPPHCCVQVHSPNLRDKLLSLEPKRQWLAASSVCLLFVLTTETVFQYLWCEDRLWFEMGAKALEKVPADLSLFQSYWRLILSNSGKQNHN